MTKHKDFWDEHIDSQAWFDVALKLGWLDGVIKDNCETAIESMLSNEDPELLKKTFLSITGLDN